MLKFFICIRYVYMYIFCEATTRYKIRKIWAVMN